MGAVRGGGSCSPHGGEKQRRDRKGPRSQYSLPRNTPQPPNFFPLSLTSQEHHRLVTKPLVYEPLRDTGALNHNSVLSGTHQNKLMAPFHRDEHLA